MFVFDIFLGDRFTRELRGTRQVFKKNHSAGGGEEEVFIRADTRNS